MEEHDNQEYYITTKDDEGMLTYESQRYRLSEVEIIQLLKILLIEGRNKSIGRKLLDIYEDSTQHRAEITKRRLSFIGLVQNGDTKPKRYIPARKR